MNLCVAHSPLVSTSAEVALLLDLIRCEANDNSWLLCFSRHPWLTLAILLGNLRYKPENKRPIFKHTAILSSQRWALLVVSAVCLKKTQELIPLVLTLFSYVRGDARCS